jgi:hypothetical protein
MGIRGALVILILVCALVPLNLSVKSQGPVIPQSPVDPQVNPQENLLSEAEKKAAFDTLMNQGNMQVIGKSVGMDDPKNEWTQEKKTHHQGRWRHEFPVRPGIPGPESTQRRLDGPLPGWFECTGPDDVASRVFGRSSSGYKSKAQ